MKSHTRLPFGLAANALSYTCGFVGAGQPWAHPHPLTPETLIDLAAELGLSSVEMPAHWARLAGPAELGRRCAARGLAVVCGGGMVRAESLADELELARGLGAKVLRCILSGILTGDRTKIGLAGWLELRAAAIAVLAELAPRAADAGIQIAVENHQDATSADLLAICESVGSPAVGVTLDCGNALAVAEHPLDYARRLAPWLVTLHLKDYQICPSDHGVRLVHCAIGDGAVDFGAIFTLLADRPELTRNIEMAAHGERHIRYLDDDWWSGFEPRPAAELIPFLRLLKTTPTLADWRTPFDRGAYGDLAELEHEQLLGSVANLARLTVGEDS
jgi:sugar phosphate isomerase/epimerase